MPSAKYINYLSGAAVAAGVGAAIALAAPGTAHAETDGGSSSDSKSTSSDSKTSEKKAEKAAKKSQAAKLDGAGDDSNTVGARPAKSTFDQAEAVKSLKRKFAGTKPAKSAEGPTEAAVEETPAASESAAVAAEPLALVAEVDQAIEVAAAPESNVAPAPTANAAASAVNAAAGPVPWSPNPFRPMPPEPVPNDMPGLIWDAEQTVVNAFAPIPFAQPFVREGFEAGFRVSQFIPFVNAVIPVVNIVGQFPDLATGDPVVFRDATQNIINNLIVTLQPVSVLYYGYDEVSDLINLEYQAQVLKEAFYSTTWNILDPFALLHNRGESGLPLSASTPTSYTPPSSTLTAPLSAQAVTLAAASSAITAVADDPGSSPLRAEDPDPIGMPASLVQARDLVVLFLPAELKPVYREGFELVYRLSQMVPFVNAVIPITEILPAFLKALGGDKAGAQLAVNQLLLTTGPVSVLYYGYDEIADLLNIEQAAYAAKEQLYSNLWDSLDPAGLLHNPGDSGLPHV